MIKFCMIFINLDEAYEKVSREINEERFTKDVYECWILWDMYKSEESVWRNEGF